MTGRTSDEHGKQFVNTRITLDIRYVSDILTRGDRHLNAMWQSELQQHSQETHNKRHSDVNKQIVLEDNDQGSVGRIDDRQYRKQMRIQPEKSSSFWPQINID